MNTKALQRRGVVKIMLAAFFWSFTGFFGKWIPWNGFSTAGYRAIAATFLLGCARKSFKLSKSPMSWLSSFVTAAASITFLVANKLTTAANAIVIQYSMTGFVILVNWLITKKKPSTRDLVTAVVVMFGVALCFLGGFGGGKLLGDLIAVSSALFFGGIFLLSQVPGNDAMTYTYQGSLLCILFLFTIPGDPNFVLTPMTALVGATMGVSVGLGYMFFSSGMRDGVPATKASIISNIEPVMSPIWVFLALGEKPGIWSIVGAAIVLGAVTLYGLNKKPASPVEQ